MLKTLLLFLALTTQAFAAGSYINPANTGNLGGFQGTNDTAYTPTLSAGFGTATNINFRYRRVGDFLIVHGTFTAGTVAASLGTISLPSGLAIDTTKLLAASTAGPCPAVGEYQTNDANQHGSMLACTSTSTTVVYNSLNFVNDGHLTPNNANGSFTSNHVATIHFAVPISGWSAGGGGSGTNPGARYHASSTSLSGSLATIVWTTSDWDTNSAMSSGVYTCPAIGKYQVNASLALSGTFALNNATSMELQVNSTAVATRTRYAAAAITNEEIDIEDIVNCAATTDTIRIQVSSGATGPGIVSSNVKNYISIQKVD